MGTATAAIGVPRFSDLIAKFDRLNPQVKAKAEQASPFGASSGTDQHKLVRQYFPPRIRGFQLFLDCSQLLKRLTANGVILLVKIRR